MIKKSIILERQFFQLAELTDKVCAAFEHKAEAKDLVYKCNIDPKVSFLRIKGDEARLTQILFILIGNAVKFTSAGFVNLDISVANLQPTQVSLHFSINDSGIGIPEEIQPLLYQPFATAQYHISSQYQGNLAINIANGLVELHGSELKFESIEGIGTTFEFEITYPLEETVVANAESQVAAPIRLAGLKVLIADDEKINVMVIKRIMEKWGIIADVAENGLQAVEQVISNDYDVILMDINMPVMNGFDAAQKIKELGDTKKSAIPIIAVTASVGAAMEEVDQFPYIDDCILKPFKPEELKEKLEKIIQ